MTLEATLSAAEVRPVFVGMLDFDGDPAYGWTGNGVFAPSGTGDPDLDGNLFSPVEGAVSISDLVENMGNGQGVSLTFAAPDTDADIVKQIVRDNRRWQLRRMKLWVFFQKADETDLLPYFEQVFGGVMVKAKTSRKPGAPGAIVIDGDVDYALAAGAPARLIDHRRYYPTDKFSAFILDLVNGALASAGGSTLSSSSRPLGKIKNTKGYGAPNSKWTYEP